MPDQDKEQPSVAYVGTWRYRNFLLKAGLTVGALGVAMVVSAVISQLWLGLLGAACWIAVGVLCYRQWRQLAEDGREIHAVRRGRSILIGLGIFLLGTAIIVLATAAR
jgi:drug/metabolite transporter (DMT)-like permease